MILEGAAHRARCNSRRKLLAGRQGTIEEPSHQEGATHDDLQAERFARLTYGSIADEGVSQQLGDAAGGEIGVLTVRQLASTRARHAIEEVSIDHGQVRQCRGS
jgi:hypothetical protein